MPRDRAQRQGAGFRHLAAEPDQPIDVDCGCVTTEVLLHWVKKAYNDGLLAGPVRRR